MRSLIVAVLCCWALSAASAPADTTLTLACQGTTALGSEDPQRVSMGIIVNFTKRTVQGFGHPGLIDYPVQITAWNDVTVAFGGTHPFGNQQLSISDSIDRVTGDLEATDLSTDAKTHKTVSSFQYSLKCRPAQRMF